MEINEGLLSQEEYEHYQGLKKQVPKSEHWKLRPFKKSLLAFALWHVALVWAAIQTDPDSWLTTAVMYGGAALLVVLGVKDTRAHRDRWIADWLDSIGYAEREANARQHPSGGGYDCDAPIYWATGTNEPAPAPAPVAFPPVVSSAASNRVSDGALAVRTPVTDDDVCMALAELGAPLAVADEASTGRVSVGPTGPQPGVMSRAWVPMVVAVAQATGLAIALPCGSGSSAMVTTNPVLAGSPLALFVMVLVVTLPLWATVAVLVGVSPLWPGREKAAAMLLIPGAAVLLNLLPLVGYALGGVNGVFAGAWAAMAVVLLGGARELMYCRRRWGR